MAQEGTHLITLTGDSYGNLDDATPYKSEKALVIDQEEGDVHGLYIDKDEKEKKETSFEVREEKMDVSENSIENSMTVPSDSNQISINSMDTSHNNTNYDKIVEEENSGSHIEEEPGKENRENDAKNQFDEYDTDKENDFDDDNEEDPDKTTTSFDVILEDGEEQIILTTDSQSVDVHKERLSIHLTKEHEESIYDADSENDEDQGQDVEADDKDSDQLSLHSENRPDTRSTLREVPGGLRAKANTPASFYTNTNDLDSPVTDRKPPDSGRAASRVSREEVFQRAMTLMSNRCTSARGEGIDHDGLLAHKEPAFGVHVPQYFYVQQSRPRPMAPLKVWRGYKGNVYFEPMTIQRVNSSQNQELAETPREGDHAQTSQAEQSPRQIAPRSAKAGVVARSNDIPATPSPRGTMTRATTAAGSTASNKAYRLINSSPQIYIMDKQAIVNSYSDNIQQDLKCIEGMESTGSLAVRPVTASIMDSKPQRYMGHQSRRILDKRDRICRGTNFHIPGGRIPSATSVSSKDMNSDVNNNTIPGHRNIGTSRGNTSRSSVGFSERGINTGSRKSSYASSRFNGRKQYSLSAGSRVRFSGGKTQIEDLMISGDKFCPPTVMSPILRSATQFSSLGNQNSTINTPDILGAFEDKLPPLEHVHVNLGHHAGAESDSEPANSRPSSYYEELKHHIKQQENLGY